MTEPHPPFPEPLDDDDDDVAWALQTAKVQWTRGGRADAVVWLRRAADSADQLGNVWRASDLRRMTDDLVAYLEQPARPAIGSSRPPMVNEPPIGSSRPPIGSTRPPMANQPPIGSTRPPLGSTRPPSRSSRPPIASQPPIGSSRPPLGATLVGIGSSRPALGSSRSPLGSTLPGIGSGPPAPLPRFVGTVELDELLAARDVVTSIPPPIAVPAQQSSYAPVDDGEFEEDIVLEDDVDDDSPDVEVAQSRDSAVELRDSEVELSDEVAILDDEELEDDVIEDDALDVPSPTAARSAYDSEELPTQPHIDSNRFPLSLLGPPDSARALESAAAHPSVPPAPEEEPQVADVLLGEVRGLEDVPPEGQAILAREARIERLGADEEISYFGLALVVKGVVKVMPAIADLACARAAKGDIVWSEGNLEDGVVLRLVSGEDGTEVAVWDAELLKDIVRDYPWVMEDLKNLADRFQALAGVAMGPMGERLDDSLRSMVSERCEIKRLLPNEILTSKGKPVGGMYIMAAGRLEIMAGDEIESELGPGDFLFGPQVLSNGAAPNDARAGKGGALVLFASRSIAHELLLSVPPLLEIFAS